MTAPEQQSAPAPDPRMAAFLNALTLLQAATNAVVFAGRALVDQRQGEAADATRAQAGAGRRVFGNVAAGDAAPDAAPQHTEPVFADKLARAVQPAAPAGGAPTTHNEDEDDGC